MNVERVLSNLRKWEIRKGFFKNCMINNVIPFGLQLSMNLALGVNNSELVTRIEDILELASSRIVETLEMLAEEKVEKTKVELKQSKEEAETKLGKEIFSVELQGMEVRIKSRVNEIKTVHNKKLEVLKKKAMGPDNLYNF